MGPQESKPGLPGSSRDNSLDQMYPEVPDIPSVSSTQPVHEMLNLASKHLTSFPDEVGRTPNLTVLVLTDNLITSIPSSISSLVHLRRIHLSHNRLNSLSENFTSLQNLEVLDLSYNEILTVTSRIGQIISLKELYLHCNLISDLPDSFGNLHLTKLSLEDNAPLVPSLSRIIGCGPDYVQHVIGFVKYRRRHLLKPRFTQHIATPTKCVFYADHLTERTSWIDPRYFSYIHTLPLAVQRMFDFSEEPPYLDVEGLAPTALCSHTNCTNRPTRGCREGMCSKCCSSLICRVHSATELLISPLSPAVLAQMSSSSSSQFGTSSLLSSRGGSSLGSSSSTSFSFPFSRRGKSFSDRSERLFKALDAMHSAEPETWREKPRLNVTLRRDHVFEDSFRDIMRATKERLKLRLNVTYFGETGLDYGGLTREWFQLVSQEFVKPEQALFMPCESNPGVFIINPLSYVNPSHLEYFRFLGRVLAKALFDQFLISVFFAPVFFKQLLRALMNMRDTEEEEKRQSGLAFPGRSRSIPSHQREQQILQRQIQQGTYLSIDDLKDIDTEQYNSLKAIDAMDDVESLGLTFTSTVDEFGLIKEVDLIEGGSEISVTKDNKHKFVQLKAQHILCGQTSLQMKSIAYGFHELIPADLLRDFTANEVEQLLCGVAEIDVEDWKRNTELINWSETSENVQWFWSVLEEMTNDERVKVFQFVTGTTKVPQGGFAKLVGSDGPRRFHLNRSPLTRAHLPTAHTCFNQLDLPEYWTKYELEEKLRKAVELGLMGFGEK